MFEVSMKIHSKMTAVYFFVNLFISTFHLAVIFQFQVLAYIFVSNIGQRQHGSCKLGLRQKFALEYRYH